MTNISANSTQCNLNNERSIRICIDNEQIDLDVLQLTSSDICTDLQTQVQNATRVVVEPLVNLLSIPAELVTNLLDILSSSQNVLYRAELGVGEPAKLFDFILTLQINTVEMGANFQRLAQRAASTLAPELDSHSADLIANTMTSARITPLPRNRIAAQIRSHRTSEQQDDKVTPQSAAELAIQRIQETAHPDELSRLRYPSIWFFQNNFLTWQETHWSREPQFDLKVTRILQQELPHHDLTTNFINSTIKNIKALVFLPDEIPLPCRIERPDAEPTEVRILQVENGIVELGQASDPTLSNADPFVFGAPRLPVEFNEQATCPTFRQTLNEIFPLAGDGDNRIAFLQEFFGYCLQPWDCSQEIFAVFVGNGANGKSVMLDILGAMLGAENVSFLNLEHFQGEFRLVNMENKLCNISSDMQRMPKVQEGLLKQMVSGERVQANIKHQSPRTMKPTAKLIFATNHLPQFSDTSDGIWRRMRVVPFLETIPEERRDRTLAKRIVNEELSGVLNFALEGYRRLETQGSFSMCSICDAHLNSHRHDSDPVAQFIDECCVTGEEHWVLAASLYKAYSGFVIDAGRRPVGKSVFGRRLASLPDIQRDRLTTGRRPYIYRGVGLRNGVLDSDTRISTSYQPPREHDHLTTPSPSNVPRMPLPSRNGNSPS